MDTTELAAHLVRSGAASEELFTRVIKRIDSYFRRVVQDDHEARDCLQETLLLLQQSLQEKKYDPERSFNVWIWLKARTVYAQWCRAKARQMQPLPQQATQVDPTTLDQRLDGDVLLNLIHQRLGAETHEAFVLYYHGELTQDEVGKIVGTHRRAVAKRIREAHALLNELLDQ